MLAVLLAGARDVPAQITAATISGTVKDETGGVLPGAEVAVMNLETGITRTAVTDANGLFTVPGLAPGRYEARAGLEGFTPDVQELTLAVAQQAGISLTLRVGAAQESVEVVASAVLVDTRSSSLSALVPEKTIEELPLNGRNYIDLALLQPGVTTFAERSTSVANARGTQLNINGMGGRSNSYLLDGANMKGYHGLSTATAADTTLGVETIREFRVVTNAFSADYGRAMGGVVNIVSKSGTNEVHGSGFAFYRGDGLDSVNYFDDEKPPFTRNQFGVAGGGPLRKNTAFFFGGVERLQEDLGMTQVTTVPGAAARSGGLGPVNPIVKPYLDLFPMPNGPDLGGGLARFAYQFNRATRENFAQARIDYRFSENDSFFGRYTMDYATQILPVEFPQFQNDQSSRNRFFTVEHQRIVTSSVLNTLRFSASRLTLEIDPISSAPSSLAFIAGQNTVGTISIGGVTTIGPSSTNPTSANSTFFTLSDDLSWTRGRHLLKVGALLERLRTEKGTSTNTRGSYTFLNLPQFLAGNPNRFTGVLPGAQLDRIRVNYLVGMYVQDDVRVTPRLTLNLGARYEFFTIPNEIRGIDTSLRDIVNDPDFTVGPPFINPSLRNIGPRAGFAWDASGDGRTSVRGGGGLYFDTDGTYNSAFGIAAFSPPFGNQVTVNNPAFPHASLEGQAASRSARTLDYHIKQPHAVTFNLNVQRELWGDIVGTLGYAGSRGYELVSATEGNPNVAQTLADGTLFFPAGAPRRNRNFGTIDYRTSGGRSWYNAVQAGALKRFSREYQVQLSYTFGKTIDTTQAQLGADASNSSQYPQNVYDRNADRALSDYDVRHVFTANFTWELPGQSDSRLLGGWQLNGIVNARGGVPFSPSIQANWSRSGNTSTSSQDRPNLKAGINRKDLVLGGPDRYFDPNAFELPPRGFFGNAGRNLMTGPGFASVDLSIVKNTRLSGDKRIQLRLEVFNVLNRANFAVPSFRTVFAGASETERPLSTAGRITNTVNASRQIQLGVKFVF